MKLGNGIIMWWGTEDVISVILGGKQVRFNISSAILIQTELCITHDGTYFLWWETSKKGLDYKRINIRFNKLPCVVAILLAFNC